MLRIFIIFQIFLIYYILIIIAPKIYNNYTKVEEQSFVIESFIKEIESYHYFYKKLHIRAPIKLELRPMFVFYFLIGILKLYKFIFYSFIVKGILICMFHLLITQIMN